MAGEMRVVHGDITQAEVDVIVNAANSSLLGGGGVDGAIHRAAGPALLAECRRVVAERGICDPGDAVMTGAGELAVRSVIRSVIHTVGPIWPDDLVDDGVDDGVDDRAGSAGGEGDREVGARLDGLLASCYTTSLGLAVQAGYRSIAFPNISTGVYGFPKARAATVALQAVGAAVSSSSSMEAVLFVCFDSENLELYEERL